MKQTLLFILILFTFTSDKVPEVLDPPLKMSFEVTQNFDDDIRIYPNPATEFIRVSENDKVKQIWIYNIFGKRIKNFEAEQNGKYDIRDLPRGMYVVRLADENNELILTRRINKINP